MSGPLVTALKWWMRGVGTLYMALSIMAFVAPGFDHHSLGFEVTRFWVNSNQHPELAAVGAILLYASGAPYYHRVVVLLVIILELVSAIGDTVRTIQLHDSLLHYVALLSGHALVAGTGILLLRMLLYAAAEARGWTGLSLEDLDDLGC